MLAELKILFDNFIFMLKREIHYKKRLAVWRVFFCAYTIRFDIAALQAGLQRYMNRLRG